MDQRPASESIRRVSGEDQILQATAELLHAVEASICRLALEQAHAAAGTSRLPAHQDATLIRGRRQDPARQRPRDVCNGGFDDHYRQPIPPEEEFHLGSRAILRERIQKVPKDQGAQAAEAKGQRAEHRPEHVRAESGERHHSRRPPESKLDDQSTLRDDVPRDHQLDRPPLQLQGTVGVHLEENEGQEEAVW